MLRNVVRCCEDEFTHGSGTCLGVIMQALAVTPGNRSSHTSRAASFFLDQAAARLRET